MFVYDFLHLNHPYEGVREQLLTDQGAWLSPYAVDACREGEQLRTRVGPVPESRSVSKEVLVALGEPREARDMLLLPMRWEATHATALFPVLEAELTLAPFEPDGTHLGLRGTYDPPLGRFGQALDDLVLHRIAEATIRGFLQRVAGALVECLDASRSPR